MYSGMGMHSVLSLFGRELSEATVRTNWPEKYRDGIKSIYGTEEKPGEGIYLYIESTYDTDHEEFLPAILNSIPTSEFAVLTQMNNTTDSGVAWGYRKSESVVEYLGEIHGEEANFGRDVVEEYKSEYGIRIWTLWEVFDYSFARAPERETDTL